jgi:hypothetical protein
MLDDVAWGSTDADLRARSHVGVASPSTETTADQGGNARLARARKIAENAPRKGSRKAQSR